MSFIENFTLNAIYILFPLILYLFYFAYNKAFEKDVQNIILDFCLLTSFYLTSRFGIFSNIQISILVFNIPLLIAYLYKRDLSVLILSVSIIIYYYQSYFALFLIFIVEYLIYYFVYLKIVKKDNNQNLYIFIFIMIKMLFTFVFVFLLVQKGLYVNIGFFKFAVYLILFIILIYFVIYLLRKGEKIVKLEMTLKELQKEKQIRTSLFKITHEIKNPIAVCKGYLDMFDVNDLKHSRKYIPIIRSEINRTLLLLQDFLDCNHLKINKDILDINLLLEDVGDECVPLLESRMINYISHIDDDELYIEGDYERLKQVFINIIKNSIEAINTSDNSYIEIDTKLEENNIHIFIEDNGTGISPEDLEKICNPFYTTKKNGTGLGITLSTEIIEAHGGKIIYTSKLGEWTNVEVILPLKNS